MELWRVGRIMFDITIDNVSLEALIHNIYARIEELELEVASLGCNVTPPPTLGTKYVVTDDKTLAKYIDGYNAAGFPLIANNIYEDESGDRLKWENGDELECVGEAIRADGGTYWLKLVAG